MLLFPLLVGLSQPGGFNHPELRWQTIETEHFLVHYHQGTQRTANRVARIAEEIYPHITGLYQYKPDGKVEFVIRDTDDYSNGVAYFYDNKIEIWAENMDYILRGTHDWLRDVVTHEFTHIVSLQKALKFGRHVPAGWLQVFGYEEERRPDVVRGFPNVLVSYPVSGIVIPIWFAEGVAQFQSPSRRYDFRDSHREMILRDRVMTNNLLDLNEMSTFGKNSIGNESAYNQGFSFVEFLTRNFGDSIISRIARAAASLIRLNFSSALQEATGLAADSLFLSWRNMLQKTYRRRLKTILQHQVTGEPFVDEGIGNLFPSVSPDGKKIAYITTGNSDYLSQNKLVVYDLQSRKREIVSSSISSSLTWSPDSRYLAYARQAELQNSGSRYNDIYVFDLQNKKEYRLTRNLRARHPDWSHDGRRIVFMVSSDGQTNLFVLDLGQVEKTLTDTGWKIQYYDLNQHRLVRSVPESEQKDWKLFYRKIEFLGESIHQLTHFTNGRQIYHPRWAPGDAYLIFDTSLGFGRDIARISVPDGRFEFVLNDRCDERNPIFHPITGELYYACDQTGIFNIYSLNLQTGKRQAHTNVVGGAFMPSLSPDGHVFYALYEHQGYKIYQIKNVNAIPLDYLTYEEDYVSRIPRIHRPGITDQPLPSRPYQRRFSGMAFMPRLLIDYGTIKPGFYVVMNEVLDKVFFIGGFDINRDQDYDIITQFELRRWEPTLFLEFYNQTTHIEDRFTIEGYHARIERQVSFNLLEARLGLRKRMLRISDLLDLQFFYQFSLYRAKSGIFSFKDPATNITFVSPPFRYTYLRGHSLNLILRYQDIRREVDRDINPRQGRYVSFKVYREWNRFLRDFATDRAIAAEIFDKYYFLRMGLDWEEYFPVPVADHHSLTVRFQGGLIDKPVDDFFHFFAGSLTGLKGYPYFSIEGRKMAIVSFTYRLPLARHLNWQILNLYFDKVYLGAFYQFGNAWSKGGLRFEDFKSDAGLQLRLDVSSWYFFPTRIFVEAAYPFREHFNQSVRYEKQWRFYFGVLFDFDLRFEKMFREIM